MGTLLQISSELAQLDELLEESGGEITPEIDLHMQELDHDFDNQIDWYAAMATELRKRAEVRKAEARRMEAKARRDEDADKYFRSCVLAIMLERGIKKVQTGRFTVTAAGNGGPEPVLNRHGQPFEADADVDGVPEAYIVRTPWVNLNKVREELKAGAILEFARLGERGHHLRIT